MTRAEKVITALQKTAYCNFLKICLARRKSLRMVLPTISKNLNMKYETYHETLSSVFEEFKSALIANGIEVKDFSDLENANGLSYGQNARFNFPIHKKKGKGTNAWAHLSVFRMDSGRYEMTAYIL